jgi:hypothetical protein
MKLIDHPLPPRRAKSQTPQSDVEGRARRPVKAVTRSDLQTAAMLQRVAIGVYEVAFRGEADDHYKPQEGTLLHRIWKMHKLTFRQQRTWKKFVEDLRAAAGESGKLVASYESAVQVSGNKIAMSSTTPEYDRVHNLYHNYLDRDERILLRDLVTDEIQSPGIIRLELIGFARNGYRDDAQARAAGVANVCNLLSRIAGFYCY